MVRAINEGREAAREIDRYLMGSTRLQSALNFEVGIDIHRNVGDPMISMIVPRAR